MNETKTMYHAVPVVSELNRVKGFDPTKFLRNTKEGPKLDLNVKRLWFRMKYPNGRIKLSALKITDQLAIIQARVYFDKNDTNHVASFTAQSYKESTPGGLYVEMAQRNAEDEALDAAGFGIQFVHANDTNDSLTVKDEAPRTVTKHAEEAPAVKVEAPPERKVEPAPKIVQQSAEPIVTETVAEAPAVKTEPVEKTLLEPIAEPIVEDLSPAPIEMAVETPPIEEAAPVIAPKVEEAPTAVVSAPSVENSAQATEEPHEEPKPMYNKTMSIEEICSVMSLDEALNYVAPSGSCKGWTLKQVAERRRPSLKWYVNGYPGDDNILRAAARIVLKATEPIAA